MEVYSKHLYLIFSVLQKNPIRRDFYVVVFSDEVLRNLVEHVSVLQKRESVFSRLVFCRLAYLLCCNIDHCSNEVIKGLQELLLGDCLSMCVVKHN